jgi:hypothetical protein
MFVNKAHSAIICGSTGCGKTEFMLNLLRPPQGTGDLPPGYGWVYNYKHIIIICPTLRLNKTYHKNKWLFNNSKIILIPDVEKWGGLDRCLKMNYETLGLMDDSPVLFIIDDCADMNDIKKKNQMITKLAFSGRHANCSVWILTQKYNSILTDFREQIKWMALFYCKDRDSFSQALKENDVIPTQEARNTMRDKLAENKYSKLILIAEQPTSYEFRL